ncbi:hypothetical protein AAG570_011426 [Ranatra chinensis]|uniref:WD repeat-containing protein on Y chromosome n=1 Tax=Ranatra chinensis TaxID=642074 RepID=A0ABD0YKT9_9HEMI
MASKRRNMFHKNKTQETTENGHVAGYVKVWLIKDFGNDTWVEEKLCMPLMRLKFPFLLNDRFPGRAKRAIRGQKEPMLLSSFRAHVNAVNHIEYIDSNEIIITSGNDCSVRFWTLGGQYIGTLGGTMEWPRISPNKPARLNKCRIPPDIKRVASSTTLKVLTNAYAPEKKKETETKDQVQFRKMMEKRPVEHEVYGQTLELPLLGNHYSIPRLKQQPREEHKISRADAPYTSSNSCTDWKDGWKAVTYSQRRRDAPRSNETNIVANINKMKLPAEPKLGGRYF